MEMFTRQEPFSFTKIALILFIRQMKLNYLLQ